MPKYHFFLLHGAQLVRVPLHLGTHPHVQGDVQDGTRRENK